VLKPIKTKVKSFKKPTDLLFTLSITLVYEIDFFFK